MKRKKEILLILIVVVFLSTTLYAVSNMSKKNVGAYQYDSSLSGADRIKRWIAWMTPHAKRIGKKYGLPWQALVVQTGWETAWGKSSLFQKAWNIAGIKAVSGEPYVTMRTHEYENGVKVWKDANFRKWNSLEDGLEGYANFFHKYSRYSKALNYPNDPYQFIVEIRNAGYATSPNYISNLHGVLDKYVTGKNIGSYSFTGDTTVLKNGSSGSETGQLQAMLMDYVKKHNYPTIKVDGIFGKRTENLLIQITGSKETTIQDLETILNQKSKNL